jgi:pSer/pThr/pTyr-binding forkhead associated (FHA) protein
MLHLPRVQSDDGGLIVSCEVSTQPRSASLEMTMARISQDVSTNGLLLNGSKIRKTAILLMDGDLLEIPQAQCKPINQLAYRL